MSQTEIPNWIRSKLDSNGLKRITTAIDDAEKTTSGEIVPMIVRSSASTGHVIWILFFIFAGLFALLVPRISFIPSSAFWVAELGAFLLAWVFAAIFSRFDFFRRACTRSLDLHRAVILRAQVEFYEQDLTKTKAGTGIFLFVSLLEREAIVLADKGIAQYHTPESWSGVIETLLLGIKNGDFAGGFSDAIALCGRHLNAKFPRQKDDQDELPNRLIIRD